MTVDPNDHDGRILYLFGTNDPKVHAVTQSLLRPGDSFLDIGANHASIGILAANLVGPSGHVHLFEPQPDICRRVGEAIHCAQLSNVTLHQCGLMDHDGEMTLSRPKHHSGMATFRQPDCQEEWDSLTLEVKDIATYLPPLIDGRPFGVKLDVEGSEPHLMPWLVSQENLRFIVFEAAHNRHELWDIVQASGLQLYGLCRRIFRMRIQRITSPDEMSSFHDLVAVHLINAMTPPEFVHPIVLRRWTTSALVS
jgi:FkbM family methyltransferase